MFNSYYTTGTVTITSGSPNFTTSGAALESAGIRPGDIIVSNGLWLVIASITGQNSGTLVENAPADAAVSGGPLRIALQTDASRLAAAQVTLISLLSGGNVQALAGLVGANGKLPIFTGAGAMDLIDAADLGTPDPNGNLAALAGLTGAANTGLHFTGAGAMATHTQTAFARAVAGLTGANGSFIRATGAGSAAMQAIVGTVSQSGGIPTGALVQYGSGDGGSFVRFAGGLQVCWNSAASGSGAVTWSYPATFSSAPAVFGTQAMVSDPSTGNPYFVLFGNVGSSTAQFSAVRSSTESRGIVSCRLLAVGVWHS